MAVLEECLFGLLLPSLNADASCGVAAQERVLYTSQGLVRSHQKRPETAVLCLILTLFC